MKVRFQPTETEREDLSHLNRLAETYLDENNSTELTHFQDWLEEHCPPLAEKYHIYPPDVVYRQTPPVSDLLPPVDAPMKVIAVKRSFLEATASVGEPLRLTDGKTWRLEVVEPDDFKLR